ncbi:MAG: rRNA maturation RNase YbeY [Chloroflexi bacterium]|nr:rRNA maturation RNase YbeY [Chloroflexota bacterium]
MPVEIRVKGQFSSRVTRPRLRRIAAKTLRAENARALVTIYITDNAEIRALNRQFHATNAPTDVLAFPVRSQRRSETESPSAIAPRPHNGTPLRSVPNYELNLGDIVISYEQAREQAHATGWRIHDELELLVVHGLLHLLGYDDRTPRARARMWRRQAEILGKEIPK